MKNIFFKFLFLLFFCWYFSLFLWIILIWFVKIWILDKMWFEIIILVFCFVNNFRSFLSFWILYGFKLLDGLFNIKIFGFLINVIVILSFCFIFKEKFLIFFFLLIFKLIKFKILLILLKLMFLFKYIIFKLFCVFKWLYVVGVLISELILCKLFCVIGLLFNLIFFEFCWSMLYIIFISVVLLVLLILSNL